MYIGLCIGTCGSKNTIMRILTLPWYVGCYYYCRCCTTLKRVRCHKSPPYQRYPRNCGTDRYNPLPCDKTTSTALDGKFQELSLIHRGGGGTAAYKRDTPWKINGWNLQITHLERKMIWTKPPWLCSMLIFRGQGILSIVSCWKTATNHRTITNHHLEPEKQPTIYKWLLQLDDSKPLLGKWLLHQTSIYKWLLFFGFQAVDDLCAKHQISTSPASSTIFSLRALHLAKRHHQLIHR